MRERLLTTRPDKEQIKYSDCHLIKAGDRWVTSDE
jgi:hypothetical protein